MVDVRVLVFKIAKVVLWWFKEARKLRSQDVEGREATLCHNFVVAEVTGCLISLGQLYHSGWSVKHHSEAPSGLALFSPCGELILPVHYRGMSLALSGWIRRVKEEETLNVRMAVEAKIPEFDSQPVNKWFVTEDDKPYFKQIGSCFLDPRPMLGLEYKFRSAFIKATNDTSGQWQMIEWCNNYLDEEEPSAMIPECGSSSWLLLFVFSSTISMDIDNYFTITLILIL